jgi:SAM-dependent methyltransferase
MDRAAAEKARRFTDEVHVGDVLAAPFAPGRFDVVTALHVLEHVPDPVRLVRRMVEWLAPGGLLIIEVPNAAGLGARLFQGAWVGLELPRHLSHFSPETLRNAVWRGGGAVSWCWQRAKPRHYVWSLRYWLEDRGWSRLAHLTQRRLVYGVLKLFLEATLPIVSRLGLGEVIRIGVAASSCRQERTGLGGPRSGMP